MNPSKLIASSAFALVVASCANNRANDYDTPGNNASAGQYGPSEAAPYQPVAPSNETYDTPPAYEEAGNAGAASPNLPAGPTSNLPPANKPPINPPPAPPAAFSGRVASTHTVVAGDTLSGIAAKYKVSSASIKQANAMTKDTVVLGKKLNIPAP